MRTALIRSSRPFSFRDVIVNHLVLCCCVLAAIGCATPAMGQGFSLFNDRNHPEYEWRRVETPHTRIHFPEHLRGIEREAAAIAETTIVRLERALEIQLTDPLDIFLSDEDDITNGYAVGIGAGFTNIWVHPQTYMDQWTGDVSWLRLVLAHEIAHLVYFQAIRGPLHPFDRLLTRPAPTWFVEGLAQYLTEDWTAYRGDEALRIAQFDDRVSWTDPGALDNGALVYAYGHARTRLMAAWYGDDIFARVVAHRTNAPIAGLRRHDFNEALDELTQTTERERALRVRRHLDTYYHLLAASMQLPDSLSSVISTPELPVIMAGAVEGDELWLLGYPSIDEPLPHLALWRNGEGANESPTAPETTAEPKPNADAEEGWTLTSSHQAPNWIGPTILRLSNGDILGRALMRDRTGSIVSDLVRLDAATKKTIRMTYGERVGCLAAHPKDDNIWYCRQDRDRTVIVAMDPNDHVQREVYTDSTHAFGGMAWDPTGTWLAVTLQHSDGSRFLGRLQLEQGTIDTLLIREGVDIRNPTFDPDLPALYVVSLEDDVPNVFALDLVSKQLRRVTHQFTGAQLIGLKGEDLLISVRATRSQDRIAMVPRHTMRPSVDSAPTSITPYAAFTERIPSHPIPRTILPLSAGTLDTDEPYRPIRNMKHVSSIVLPYVDGDARGISGFTTWIEPLGKHFFGFGGNLSFRDPAGQSGFSLGVLNRSFRPSIEMVASRVPIQPRPYDNKVLFEDVWYAQARAWWPIDRWHKPYRVSWFASGLAYRHITAENATDFVGGTAPMPASGQQLSWKTTFLQRYQTPYRFNDIHPLAARGMRLELSVSPTIGSEWVSLVRFDAAAYSTLPGLGKQRWMVYGRLQVQQGDPLAQDWIGLSRYDAIQVGIFQQLPVPIIFSDASRVRGYRRYETGNAVAFGSIEYRVPLLRDARTTLFGTLSAGAVTLAGFVDAGIVWTGAFTGGQASQAGIGVELKNAIQVGPFTVLHSVGVAEPVLDRPGARSSDYYYRIRTTLPF